MTVQPQESRKLPTDAAVPAPDWLCLLGTSEQGGRDYAPVVEGDLPVELNGALYRNGPGLFERGGVRKRHLLDGDGLIQRLSFAAGRVRYQNSFVRTPKFVAEEKAGRLLHATWTTHRPGGALRNLGGGGIESQAGVTVNPVYGRVIARDEAGPSYLLDPEMLTSEGTIAAGDVDKYPGAAFKAHSKMDPETGEWLLAGQQFGRTMTLHHATYAPGFNLVAHHVHNVPRQVYIHDFFATRRYFVHVLHPCVFSPMRFLAGTKSFTESLSWHPGEGNVIAVAPREGGDPVFLEAPAAFMWHALNAYERNGEIIADFVGYDEPDHFIGDRALFRTLMTGQMGRADSPGKIRRYVVDVAAKSIREEIIDHGNHEFPMLDERRAMAAHKAGYFCTGGPGGLNTGLKRLDYATGTSDSFDFGPDTHVGEPVFIARPGGSVDEGWLMAQCLDGASGNSFFALLDAQAVSAGPIARIRLSHHVPLSFHGAWQAA